MQPALTTDRLRGLAAGALILTGFGSFWVFVVLLVWAGRPPGLLLLAVLVAVGLALASVWRFLAAARAPNPDDAEAARKGRASGVVFGVIFGVEGALIGVGAAVLSGLGLGLLIPFFTALVVGLHFLPLARVFSVPLYAWTGGVLSLLAVGCALLPVDPSLRLRALGLTVGATLWLTATAALYKTRLPEGPPSKTG
jgi:hypothetical protein